MSNQRPIAPYRPSPQNYRPSNQPFYYPMYFPGQMNWFPLPPHPQRMRKPKTPSQLKRIQKRTLKHKMGELTKHATNQAQDLVINIPNQDLIRLDESISTNESKSVQTEGHKDFISMVQQMQVLSSCQSTDLRKEAEAAGHPLPRVCVDRGVMEYENETDDQGCTSYDMDMVPSSVSITLCHKDGWKRSCKLICYEAAYGEKPERVYASMFPFNFGGLSSNQIKKIIRELSSKKLRKKPQVDSDELARKASEMKLTSFQNPETNLLSNALEMHPSSQTMDTPVNHFMNSTPGTNMQFHVSRMLSPHRDEDDTMDLSEFPDSL